MPVVRKSGRYFRAVHSALVDLIVPMACPLCEAETVKHPICTSCRDQIVTSCPRCSRCGMPAGPWANLDGGCSECRERSIGFDAAITVGNYSGEMKQLCLKLKNHANAWLVRWLADLVVETRRSELEIALQNDPKPIVIAIPLHWRRRFDRGYNQAEAIARRLARRLKLPVVHNLRRIKNTEPLAEKSRTERLEVMHDAFTVRRPEQVKGRTIVLVDDILTSGATCGSAARALKKAGAKRVVVVVLGRA